MAFWFSTRFWILAAGSTNEVDNMCADVPVHPKGHTELRKYFCKDLALCAGALSG